MGYFTSFAWRYIEKGSSAWQKNWEQHIDFLEDNITGRLHKTVLGTSSKFYSISSIHATFISAMIWFWGFLFVLSIFYALGYGMNIDSGIEAPLPMLMSHRYYHIDIYLVAILIIAILGILAFRIVCLKEKTCGYVGKWRSSEKTIPRKIYSPDENAMHKRNLPKMHKPLD